MLQISTATDDSMLYMIDYDDVSLQHAQLTIQPNS